MKEWVQNLKKGDNVIVSSRGDIDKIHEVERTTKTLVIVRNYRFNKETLKPHGQDRYAASTLFEYTKRECERIYYEEEKHSIVKELKNVDFNSVSLEDLKTIKQILNK